MVTPNSVKRNSPAEGTGSVIPQLCADPRWHQWLFSVAQIHKCGCGRIAVGLDGNLRGTSTLYMSILDDGDMDVFVFSLHHRVHTAQIYRIVVAMQELNGRVSNLSISTGSSGTQANGHAPAGQTIIGIDFGTTFTSCSYSYVSGSLAGNEKPLVNDIKAWSSFPGKNEGNIPSKLYYMIDPTTRRYLPIEGERQIDWGLRSLSVAQRENIRLKYPKLEMQEFEWFKLHLKVDFSNMDAEHRQDFERERRLKQLPTNITALEAATDFLRCIITDIEKNLRIYLSERDPEATHFVYVDLEATHFGELM